MSLLTIQALTFNYVGTPLLESINGRLLASEHVVLLGPNGTGKSTLMRLLMQQIKPDQGVLKWEPQIKVRGLDQQLELPLEKTVLDFLSGVFQKDFQLEKQMQKYYLESTHLSGEAQLKKIAQATRIQELLNDSGFYQYQTEINKILTGVGLSTDILNSPIKTLSGGMRSKVKLAELLLAEADVLLLDEPTNFLDEAQVQWLIKYLRNWPKAFILVTHEPDVAKEVAQVVWAIEQRSLSIYKGDYQYYLAEKELRASQHQKAVTAQQKWIKNTETFIAKNIVRASTTKLAQSRRKQLEKTTRLTALEKAKHYQFEWPLSRPTGQKVLVVEHLEIGYDAPLVEPIDWTVRKGEKWVVTGKNGIGKSTLMKSINAIIPALSGDYQWIETADINYFSQERTFAHEETPFSVIYEAFPLWDHEKIYSLLGLFGLRADKAKRSMRTLSGGEQTKVRMALIAKIKSNVLVFDEPTNHLDISIKKALQEALINYQGTLILVSHEKPFYEAICDHQLNLERSSHE
jgi:ATPase subunit of ABC transporter with duplicated ATPase domains